MNRRGFTLVELLATIVILGIVVGIAVIGLNANLGEASSKTEDIFIKTLKDALDIYLDSDAKKLHFSNAEVCTLHKKLGDVKVYKATDSLNFDSVINSEYVPLVKQEVVNPAHVHDGIYECSTDGVNTLSIYRDEDYVYYYKIDKSSFECLTIDEDNPKKNIITNLPEECLA